MPNPDPKDHPSTLDDETPKPVGNELAGGCLAVIGSLCILAAVPLIVFVMLVIGMLTREIPSRDRSEVVGLAFVWLLTSVTFIYMGYRLITHVPKK